MTCRLVWLFFCLLAFAGIAESFALSPRLAVPPQAGDQPVELRKLRVNTEISGGVAQTTLEMEFYNPNRRVLEGELQFPLLPRQEVTGFALDINGKLRDAVPVEKARGQEVFEEIVLRQAKSGTYRISVNYAWDRRQTAAALPPVAQVRVFRNFGTPKQVERIHTVRFQRAGQQTAVGELVIPPDNAAP